MKPFTLLAVAVAALAVGGLFVGRAGIAADEIWSSLGSLISFGDTSSLADGVIRNIRLPRVIGGALVGVSLGVSGAGLQGVYRNNLVEPYLLGVSSAAGFGLLIGLLPISGNASVVLATTAATVTGAAVALASRRLARRTVDPAGFILVGLAMGLGLLAWILVVVFAVDSPRLPTFTYFVFGGLVRSSWWVIVVGLPFLAGAGYLVARAARSLDIMSLGDEVALTSGVDVDRVSRSVLVGAGALAGVGVALAGVVGFVGLLGPLAARRLVGPMHKNLIPASALCSILVVLLADLAIRAMPFAVEIPLGVVTSAVGAPLLVVLLFRGRRS